MTAAGHVHDVIVVGAGAAGLFAAAEAAERGAEVLVLEKNARPGIKILASGGSKCNVTSTLPVRELGAWFGARAERFLRHGLHAFGPADVRALLERGGVRTTELPFEKVFPEGGRAADVLRVFLDRLERSGARLALSRPVLALARDDAGFAVRVPDATLRARRVVVTCGGASYPKTGCTGDGYPWLADLGHTITPPRPALVPLRVDEPWVRALTGIAVPGAEAQALDARGRPTFTRRRPVLFTHRGLSGPGPMDCSRWLFDADAGAHRPVRIDWLPELAASELEETLGAGGPQLVANRIPDVLPRRLIEALAARAGMPLDRKAAELRREERTGLVAQLKACVIPVSGDEGFPKAEVTAGGVALDEVDPRTMRSRIVPDLLVAGEILDVDGPIGGFNFQAAFSTGTLAGRAAAEAAVTPP